jgi:hypothetical protein
MDRALWMLMQLRFKGWLRQLRRALLTVKGVVVALLCLLCFAPLIISLIISWLAATPPASAEHAEAIRRFVPLVLLALCVGNIATAAGEKAIAFSPAEVNLLFTAPFSRRQLLAYKLVFDFCFVLVIALVMAICFSPFTSRFGAAFVGIVLGFMFLHLILMTVVLIGSMVGAQAYNRRRRWALAILAALGMLVFLHIGSGIFELSPSELLERAEQAPALVVVLTPFRWYVNAFTATQYWPELAQWVLPGLAVDIGLVVIVFALDAHYLETAANAGEKIYANLQKMRSGGLAAAFQSRPGKARFRLPDLPWWGGIGPIAWRQLTAAPRSHGLMGYILLLAVILVIPIIVSQKTDPLQSHLAPLTIGFMAWISFLLTPMITFDFRSDLDRMDVLKTVPLRASRIVLGQLLTPVLITTLVQWLLLVILIFLGHRFDILLGAIVFVVPFNLLLFGIDNLLFLWYPTPPVAATAGSFQMMGRNMLLMMAKFIFVGLIGGATGLVAVPVYFLMDLAQGPSWLASLTVAWLLLTGFAIGLVPLVALAFRRFDVARDMPP